MADIQVVHPPNGGKAFWSDLSKKTGTWTAVSVLAVSVLEIIDQHVEGASLVGVEHVVAVLGAAVLSAIIGLVQGKIGDPAKASFKAAPPSDPDDDLGD